MDEGFDRLAELFARVRRIPPGSERDAVLADVAGQDPDLRTRLDDLLAQHDAADEEGFGLGLEGVATQALLEANDDEAVPSIAGFRILRRLGEGGMGTVWEAEQERPRRRVAIKVLRPELTTTEGRKRFEREADLLAGLSHPGIARIHQQGVADMPWGPQPFLAMEFVDGEPLTLHARRSRLGQRERVGLLVKVCDAVGHLHEHGVIHRDLKPGNILVTADSTPKVLDFGIARDLDSGATLQTRPGAVLGTLDYMSPEQASGLRGAADTRSDVYALGVLAYELLAGRLPFELEGRGLPAAIRTIVEREPPTLGTLDHHLRGDLSAIVAKALDKDKTRRYASAAALAEDLRRHLADEVVLASRISAIHQVRKFVRRHTAWVTGAAAVVIALVAGLAVSLHLMRIADDEALAARAATRLARLQAAAAALQHEEIPVLQEHLEAIPEPTRGWAWRYLHAQLDGSLWSQPVPSGCQAASLAPDGTVLVGGHTPWEARYFDPDTRGWSEPFALGNSVKTMAAIVGEQLLVGTSPLSSPSVLVDVRTGAQLGDVDATVIAALAGSADGRRVAIQSAVPPNGGSVDVLDALSGRRIRHIDGQRAQALALDATGGRLAVAHGDEVRVFEVGSDAPPLRLHGHEGECWALAFSPDGSQLATGSDDHAIRLWNIGSGEVVREIRGLRTKPRALAFVGAERLAFGLVDGSVRIWDRGVGRVTDSLLGHTRPLQDILASGDELLTVTCASVRRWAIGRRPPNVLTVHGRETRTGWPPYVYFARFTPDGAHVVSGGWDGYVRVTDVATGEALAAVPSEFTSLMALSADARMVVAGAHHLQFLDPATAALHGQVAKPEDAWCVSLSPDGGMLYLGLTKGRVELVDVASGESRGRVDVFERGDTVRAIVQESSANRFLAVGDRGSASICRAADGAVLRSLRQEWGAVGCAALGPRGRLVATGGGSGVVRICRVEDGRTVHLLEGHGEQVYALAFSPDGAELATGSNDGVVRIWEVASGKLLLRLRGHTRYVKDVAFSPDGQTLLSASGDGTIRVWSGRSFADRFAEAQAVLAAEDRMRSSFEARLRAGTSAEEVVAEVAADPTLTPMERRAVRNLVLKAVSR